MPRAKGVYGAKSIDQLKNNAFPEIEKMWKLFGLIEGYHYVKFKKPPSFFAKPLSPPNSYKNVVSFYNGHIILLFSALQANIVRSGSFDYAELDEAGFYKEDFFSKQLLPAIRGNLQYFADVPGHHQVSIYSSMPWKKEGKWVLKYEDLAKLHPDEFHYQESTTLDNIEIYGRKKFEQDKKTIGHLEFQVEYMNLRIDAAENAFYHALDEEKHLYESNYEYLSRGGSLLNKQIRHSTQEAIEASFDFSGWFNCATIYQKDGPIERMINAFHTKENSSLDTLVDNICSHYATQQNKYIRIFGEPRGHDRRPEGQTLYQRIATRFSYHGWVADIMVEAGIATDEHEMRYLAINDILTEAQPHYPTLRICEDTCKDVVLAMKLTEIDHNFKKNKKTERDRKFPQENAPHYTDTVDYFFTQKYSHMLTDDDEYAGDGFFA